MSVVFENYHSTSVATVPHAFISTVVQISHAYRSSVGAAKSEIYIVVTIGVVASR
jgi:hypothetical protein